MENGKDVYDWISHHRLWHLCLEDLQTMKPGDEIDVAIFDRNMEEYGMWDKLPPNTPHLPKDLIEKTSVGWWTTVLKLDLEARGLIERLPTKGRQRVRKTK